MQTKTPFNFVTFRKEIRNLKEITNIGLSDENYFLLVSKVLPEIRKYPERIDLIIKNIDKHPYNKLKDILIKIKIIYDECSKIKVIDDYPNKADLNILSDAHSHIQLYAQNILDPSSIKNDCINIPSNLSNSIDLNKFIEIITANKHTLSIRTQNIIDYQIIPRLNSQELLINELNNIEIFLSCRNCGKRSANEMVDFFSSLKQNYDLLIQEKSKETNKAIIESPLFGKQTIFILLENYKADLSNRSQNGLNKIMNNIMNNPETIFEYSNEMKILTIENIGLKSASELSLFFKKIITELNELCTNDSNIELNQAESTTKSMQFLTSLGLFNTKVSYKSNFNLYFLSLLEKMMKKSFKTRDTNMLLEYFSNEKTTLESLAKKHNVTRERIRQLILNKKLELLKLKNNLDDTIKKHNITVIKTWEENPNLGLNDIIDLENLTLPPNLVEFLITEKKSKINNPSWYREKAAISTILKIDDLLTKIKELNTKVSETFTINLSGFVYNFLIDKNDAIKINKIIDELEVIIFKSCGLITNLNGELVFEKNTKEKEYEKIIEIFVTEGRPLHLSELSKLSGKSVENLRGILLRNKSIFINTAFSTYGLKIWEKDGNIKGGMIIELIYNFLKNQEFPLHSYHISKEITKYRTTNERSIIGLIKSDKMNKFISFGGSFYGVKGIHDNFLEYDFKGLYGAWHKNIQRHYKNQMITKENFIASETKKYKVHTKVIEANLERRIDMGEINISEAGYLLFNQNKPTKKIDKHKINMNG